MKNRKDKNKEIGPTYDMTCCGVLDNYLETTKINDFQYIGNIRCKKCNKIVGTFKKCLHFDEDKKFITEIIRKATGNNNYKYK